MSDLYRLDLDHEHFRWASGLPEWLIPVDPVFYVFRQGGISGALYECDRDEADGMVFAIEQGEEE